MPENSAQGLRSFPVNLIRKSIRFLLQAEGSPESLAVAFALGVFLGFSPLLGLHTLLGLALAVAFRLNKLVVLLGVYLNNPWVILPFYGLSFLLGIQLTGAPDGAAPLDQLTDRLAAIGFTTLLQADFWSWAASQWELLIPFFVGSFALCTAMALASYPLTLYILRRFKPSGGHETGTGAESPLSVRLEIRKTP